MLTNISLPCNAGIASGTSDVPLGTCSRRRLRRELRLVSDECNFQQFYYTSLAASASLLSSVSAFKLGSPVNLYYLRKRNGVKAGIPHSLCAEQRDAIVISKSKRTNINPQL